MVIRLLFIEYEKFCGDISNESLAFNIRVSMNPAKYAIHEGTLGYPQLPIGIAKNISAKNNQMKRSNGKISSGQWIGL